MPTERAPAHYVRSHPHLEEIIELVSAPDPVEPHHAPHTPAGQQESPLLWDPSSQNVASQPSSCPSSPAEEKPEHFAFVASKVRSTKARCQWQAPESRLGRAACTKLAEPAEPCFPGWTCWNLPLLSARLLEVGTSSSSTKK